jgi:broad specificity phosphatase PhoE
MTEPRAILTLVRHGETSANREGIWHGSIDTELSERGHRQAAAVAEFLARHHPDARAIYSSPLRRALHTARAIQRALDRELALEAGLAEYHLGSWEGLPYAELHGKYDLWTRMREDLDFAPHGGESPRQVTDRLCTALRRIAHAHPGERVVVVTHGGALAMALGAILDGDPAQWRRVMRNCAVSELVLAPEPELLSFDRDDHLAGL